MVSPPRVGILALQGDFAAHSNALLGQGLEPIELRSHEDLPKVEALVIPGGESSTMLKLATSQIRSAIVRHVGLAKPVLATCAGAILLSRHVINPHQESLELLDITVKRNAYGRQLNSFISSDLFLSHDFGRLPTSITSLQASFEGVFIRAPKFTQLSPEVEALAFHESDPVLGRQGHILGASFHPELSPQPHPVYELFASVIREFYYKGSKVA